MSKLQFKLVELLFPKVDQFITKVIEENVQYHTELLRKSNDCNVLDTTLAHKEERIEDLEIEVDAIHSDNERLRGEVYVEQERNGLLESENRELQLDLFKLEGRYADKIDQIEELTDQIERITQEMEDLR